MDKLLCISRLMISQCFGLRLRSFFCVLAVSLCAVDTANAENYYWTYSNTGVYDSPEAACAGHSDRPPIYVNPSYYYCNDGGYTNGFASRFGDSCPSGYTENKKTGLCEAPSNKCAILKDTQVPSFRFKSTSEAPTGTISKNGCAVTLGSGICVTRTAPFYDCTFSGTITGDELADATGQSTSDCSGSACSDGQPEKTAENTPCVMMGSGSTKTCTSSEKQDNPGNMKCGTANGSWVCTESPKSTSKAETNKVTQTTSKSDDGSTTVKTTTETTTTACKGAGNCTTGTTTSTTTGGTNADGTDKGSATTCNGDKCNGGDVEAPDDEEGDEEEKDDSSVSGDMTCPAVVACSGDVIQCAVLRQAQQSRCEDQKFRDMSADKTDAAIADVQKMVDEKGKLEAKPENTFDFKGVIDTSSRFTSSCPRLEVISVPWMNGTSFRVDPNVDGLCLYLTYMGYIMVAFAMMAALKIVLRR